MFENIVLKDIKKLQCYIVFFTRIVRQPGPGGEWQTEATETLEEWNGPFTKHGLNINLEKTEVLHIGHQREELDIELEGKKMTQEDSFVYLGGAVCGDRKTEREVHRRAQAGANAWRAVEGGDGRPADLKKTEGQGHEHLCYTGMPVPWH